MSSSFNWWEDDDDDHNNDDNGKLFMGRDSQLSEQIAFGFSQNAFRCDHCGGTDSYHDSTSGQDVCTSCFTQSQMNLSQEVDDDDINVLAARRGTTLKAIRQSFGKNGGDGRSNLKGKLPLETLDQSKPLPTVDICLEAMSLVIVNAARLFAIQVLGLKTVPDRVSYLQTVKNLWIRYLSAWMEGANELGEHFPQWRFSFRDHFLPTTTRSLVMANLAYWSKKMVDEQKTLTESKDEKNIRKGNENNNHDENNDDGDDDDDSRNFLCLDSPSTSTKDDCRKQNLQLVDPHPILPSSVKRHHVQDTNRSTKKPKRVNTSVERLILSLQDRSNYKQAALKLEPSMDLVLAILWLACSKSGVTSFQACHWMTQSPLLRAFELLPESLQEKVAVIETFFAAPCAPRPRTLEETASLLAAACQMKTEGNWSFANSEILFHSPKAVPIILTRLTANAGLDQVVLNRTLGLLGLEENEMKPLKGVTLDHFSRNEDFLAVIAIACIMDPNWTSWSFQYSGKVNIPLNECHFAQLKNGDVEHYLNFLDRQKLFTKSRVWDGFDDLAYLAQQNYPDSKTSETPSVRLCPIVSDFNGIVDKEAKFHTLLGFLAYSIQGDVSRIRDRLSWILELNKK